MTAAETLPLPDPELERLLELASGLAEVAGELISDLVAEDGRLALRESAGRKSTRTDLVTQADRRSEQLIRESLRSARPEDGFLGEEGGSSGGSSGLTWVVDPLDGTVNFVYGFPAWSVSIGLADAEGRGVLGVVRDVERKETFTAVRHRGARLDGTPLRIRPSASLGESLVATGFGYAAERRAAQAALLPAVLPAVRDIRRAGSAALDLCWVAAGRLDAFYEAGLNPWDSTAGLLVAEEAGAACELLDGLVPDAPTLVVAAPERLGELTALLRSAAGQLGSEAAARDRARPTAPQ